MKNILVVLVTIILSGCSPLNFQYNTLNTVGHLDSIYGDVEIIETEADVRRKLARDFRFRLDLQRYWNSQPYGIVAQYYWSLDRGWNYGFNSPYQMYNSYDWFDWWHPNWVRHHRYWHWYYPRPYGWYGWNHWSYSHYQNPMYSWNNGPFNNSGYNVIYNASRRGALTSISNRIQTNRSVNVNNRPVVVNKPIVRFVPNQNQPSNNNIIRVKPNNNYVPNNNRPPRPTYNNNNSRPSNNNWSRPSNNVNSKPSISRNSNRSVSPPSKRGGN